MSTEERVRFRYQALHPDGSHTEGSVAAASEAVARTLLAERKLWVVRVEPDRALALPWRSASTAELGLFLELLAGLLESGLSLSRALTALDDFAPERTRPLVQDLAAAIREGRSFGGAIAQSGMLAPEVSSLVQSGEATGALAVSVRGAATLLLGRAARRRALQSALAYPALLFASSAASVVVMVGVVLPRFTAMLGELRQDLPPVTQFVVTTGAIVRSLLLPGAVTGAISAVVVSRVAASPTGRRRLDAALLRMPFVGPLRLASASSRLTGTMGTLLAQGLPVRSALRLAVSGTGDAAIAEAAETSIAAVANGTRLSLALGDAGVISRRSVHLLAAGEESGQLAGLAQRAGVLDAEWVDRRLALLLRVVEPLLIIAFAGVVALIAAAMLQAVYAIRPSA